MSELIYAFQFMWGILGIGLMIMVIKATWEKQRWITLCSGGYMIGSLLIGALGAAFGGLN